MRFFLDNARWLIAGLVLTFASNLGQTFFIGLFSGELRREFGLSHGEFGTLYSIATVASGFTIIWLGKIADSENFRLVAVTCIALLATMALALAVNPAAFLLLPILYGLRLFGQGMMGHLAGTAMGKWFARNRGRAVAIASMGQPVGEAVLPALVVAAIGWIGWRATWGVGGGIGLVVIVPLIWMLLSKERTPQSLLPDPDRPDAHRARDRTRAEVLKMGSFYLLLFALLAPGLILTGVFFHQVHIVEAKGWSLQIYASAFSVYALCSFLTVLIAGLAVDRFTGVALLRVVMLPLLAALAILMLFDGQWAAWVFLGLGGVNVGIVTALFGAIWPELYGTRHLGGIRALATAAGVVGTAVAPVVLGILIDIGVPLTRQIGGMMAYAALAAVILVLLTPRLKIVAAETAGLAPRDAAR